MDSRRKHENCSKVEYKKLHISIYIKKIEETLKTKLNIKMQRVRDGTIWQSLQFDSTIQKDPPTTQDEVSETI